MGGGKGRLRGGRDIESFLQPATRTWMLEDKKKGESKEEERETGATAATSRCIAVIFPGTRKGVSSPTFRSPPVGDHLPNTISDTDPSGHSEGRRSLERARPLIPLNKHSGSASAPPSWHATNSTQLPGWLRCSQSASESGAGGRRSERESEGDRQRECERENTECCCCRGEAGRRAGKGRRRAESRA